ncbi:MAG: tetratricopeptide repeat protein [Aureliella sp.]
MEKSSSKQKPRFRQAFLLFLLVVLLGLGWRTDAAGQLLRTMANRALDRYSPYDALIWCQRALNYGRDDAATLLLSARANLQLNMNLLAEEQVEEASRQGAPSEQVALYRILIAAQRGDSTAIEHLLAPTDMASLPREANEAVIRGTLLKGDFTRNKLILVNLQQSGEDLPIVHYHLGRKSEIDGDNVAAASSYKTAFEMQPNLTRAALRAANCLSKQSRHDDAEEMLRKVLRGPFAEIASIELANCLWEQNQPEEAQKLIQPVLNDDPRRIEVLYYQIDEFVDVDQAALVATRIEDSLQHNQTVVELSQRVLSYNHRSFEARALLIKNLRILGRMEESQSISEVQDQMIANRQRCRQLRIELEDDSQDLAKRIELAGLYWSTESAAEAKLLLSQILESNPNCPQALHLLENFSAEERALQAKTLSSNR